MKSKLFLFLFLTVFTLNVYAHGGASAIYGVKWTPVNEDTTFTNMEA